ncbi:MAG: hypothetical protein OXG13_05005 [Gemmatimonadaceae bacterium]|nr:hypothetical protein [Gemmatimonadaceae bacterium]
MPKDYSPAAYRIGDALNLLEEAYNRSGGVVPDLAPDYEAVQQWLWVPSLYSAIEQGLKWLVRYGGKKPDRTHRLSDLYDEVSCDYKRHLDGAYMGYIELHEGMSGCPTLGLFLDRLDVGVRSETEQDQDGYTTWRYLLLEGFPRTKDKQPRVSIGAMLEIGRAIRHILFQFILSAGERAKWQPGQIAPFQTLIPRLHEALNCRMREIADRYCQRPEIEEAAKRDSEAWRHHFQESYSATLFLINRDIAFLIEFLLPSIEVGERWEVPEDLKRICEAMRDFDRENFLQYCVMVKKGRLTIPSVQFDVGIGTIGRESP